MSDENPILNNPYFEPTLHYATSVDGSLDYEKIMSGRRPYIEDQGPLPGKAKPQKEIFTVQDYENVYASHWINLTRKEVGNWRTAGYPDVTRVTKELLSFWFLNEDRLIHQQCFFAQREAIETGIWLNEVAGKTNAGQNILNQITKGQSFLLSSSDSLPRIAFKMATGTGKTVVMAMMILYHYFNRQEYSADTRFADYFLLITPGITIKDRLGVLYVDSTGHRETLAKDYYHQRFLVPSRFEDRLKGLNARIIISNYHALEPKTLQGNKKSPFDGKAGADGKKQEALESFTQVLKRLMPNFKAGSRLLVINDEAHHCYKPVSPGKTTDNEEADENERAAVWYSGLLEMKKRFKLQQVYDLSATPYFLNGSGYPSYSLFPWVVSDFGLIEAIESGLVKIPFLPERDTTHKLDMPVLKNLYENVKDQLPKKGQKGIRKAEKAKQAGSSEALFGESEPSKQTPFSQDPNLPETVNLALQQLYDHYEKYENGLREQAEASANLFTTPPVFIVVANNTTVSREIYRKIAGYEILDGDGNVSNTVAGKFEKFSNFDPVTRKLRKKPPTLLIDSDALENSNQVNDEFRKVFAPEIEEFKREYARLKGQGSVNDLTDTDILRELVNTVGKPSKLGGHIRCVVSVSMLTEGWDANTVTHIMGLRAFGSQLLCEQVAGRALRRMSYVLQGYDANGNPVDDPKKAKTWKFPPEYAHIIGVPFKMFKGGKTVIVHPVDYTRIHPVEEKAEFELTFPQLDGYRLEHTNAELKADFTGIENFEIDYTKIPEKTELMTPVSGEAITYDLQSLKDKRDQEVIFQLTRWMLRLKFRDEDGNSQFHRFNQIRQVVETWYRDKITVWKYPDIPDYKRMVLNYPPETVTGHIYRGIINSEELKSQIRPVFNVNKFGSTRYVNGLTSVSKDLLYVPVKSHVNFVVPDTKAWEQIAAKELDELPEVIAYVKNSFLGFTIPYVKDGLDRKYIPDYLIKLKTKNGKLINLILEITGMNKDKEAKRHYVKEWWLPAVNSVAIKYGFDRWEFLEINGEEELKNMRTTILKDLNGKVR